MKKVRVPLYGSPQKSVTVNADATDGATVGVNLWNRDGTLFIPAAAGDGGSEVARTVWRLVLEIPANVNALAATTGTGLYAITSDGTSATRSITSSTLDVANEDGVAGNPAVDLPELPNAGGGTLQKSQRDQYGRLAGTSDATTDDLPEGANLYFTTERAAEAAPIQSLVAGDNVSIDATDPRNPVIAVPAGTQGPPGKDGQIRFTGHGPPGVLVGAEPGDTYMDLSTGTVYKLS